MENPSLQIGNNNWAVKDGSILGYNIIQDNYLPQPITFTRASSATRVNAEGLIEGVRTNLILQSNTFSTTWTNFNTTETSGQSGYDGTNNAWLLSKAAASASINQTVVATGLLTQSVYAKAGTLNWFVMNNSGVGSTGVYFDLQNGVLGGVGANAISPSIEAVGGGWYRCSLSFSGTSSAVRIYPAEGNNDISGTSGNILIQSAQLETGDIATEYIPTTTAAVSVGITSNIPRIDYSTGSPSLLLEPQRTNIVLNNNDFSAGTWGLTLAASLISNNVISPDGTLNADTLVAGVGGAQIQQAQTGTSGTVYTVSMYMKRISGSGAVYLRAVENTNTPVTITNEWTRVSLTVTSTTATIRVGVRLDISGDQVAIWGAQVELGSYSTSLINTSGTAVTRVKDSASKTGISSLIGQTEGTLFAEVEIPVNTQDGDIIAIRNGTGSANGIFVSYRSSSVVQLIVRTGSTNALIFQRSGSYAIGTNKIAVAYKNGDFAISLNGTAAQVNTSSITMPTSLDSVALFGDNMYAQTLPVPYAQALLFKTRLTNAELATLTTI